jgi:hypothetical protein
VLGIALALQVLAIYVPGVNTLIGNTPLPITAAVISAALGIGAIVFSLKTMKL